MTAIGANPDSLDQLATVFSHAAADLVNSRQNVTNDLYQAIWMGADADNFRNLWDTTSSPNLTNLARVLDGLATTLRQNADAQRMTSQADVGVFGGFDGRSSSPPPQQPPADISNFFRDLDPLDLLDVWKGSAPIRAVLFGVKAIRYGLGSSNFPTLNNGILGKLLAGVPKLGPWMATPAATQFFQKLGVVGGVVGTGLGAYNLYQQGNPIDAFQRDPGAYASDVAGTAFSAASTAFLLAPNPFTGALALGTAAIWAGTEVWDHWDQISAGANKVWDATTDAVGDAWDDAADFGADAVDTALDTAGDVASHVADKLSFWN